jgi:hypothetical protein
MFAIAAIVAFILACLKVEPFETVKMIPLGLLFLACAIAFGNWPLGYITSRRE